MTDQEDVTDDVKQVTSRPGFSLLAKAVTPPSTSDEGSASARIDSLLAGSGTQSAEWLARLHALDAPARSAGAPAKRFLTVKETADLLGWSPKTIYRRIEDGKLKASQSKPGAPYRIDRDDLEAYIDAHSTAPTVHDIEPWQS